LNRVDLNCKTTHFFEIVRTIATMFRHLFPKESWLFVTFDVAMNKYFLSLTNRKFVLVTFGISLFFFFVSSGLYSLCGTDLVRDLLEEGKNRGFLLLVIVAPVLETIIFQFLILEFFRLGRINPSIAISISGLAFGSVHYFNSYCFFEFAATTLTGVLWAYFYMITKERKGVSAFLLIVSIHAFENLLASILTMISG